MNPICVVSLVIASLVLLVIVVVVVNIVGWMISTRNTDNPGSGK